VFRRGKLIIIADSPLEREQTRPEPPYDIPYSRVGACRGKG